MEKSLYSKEERSLAKEECCNNHSGSKCLMHTKEGCHVIKLDNQNICSYFERAVKPLLAYKVLTKRQK